MLGFPIELRPKKGTARNDPHRRKREEVPDVEVSMDATPTVSIDLMYLYNKGERGTGARK